MILSCPVCGKPLTAEGMTMKCPDGHSFDVARQHYVNLLLSNAPREKRHGDDRAMVRARTEFLDAGYYDAFRDALAEAAAEFIPGGSPVIDAGCGEGFYTSFVRRALNADMCGADISKAALIAAARRDGALTLAAAGVNRLPVPGGSCAGVLNIFAPCCPEEFARVLRPGGVLIRGVPSERHLWGLKAAVYENPYLNPPPETEIPGFTLVSRRDVNGKITLRSQTDIHNLFLMTPYYYKTGQADQEKLSCLGKLETELGFTILTYRKKC
jgi:23S rRNA (guanine745-N1)-methyltransferase